MSDPLREAATRLADEWQYGTADDEYCERLDVACAALREALAIEPEYEWRAVEADHSFPTGTFRERARAEEWSARTGGYLQRRIKAGEWERLP